MRNIKVIADKKQEVEIYLQTICEYNVIQPQTRIKSKDEEGNLRIIDRLFCVREKTETVEYKSNIVLVEYTVRTLQTEHHKETHVRAVIFECDKLFSDIQIDKELS